MRIFLALQVPRLTLGALSITALMQARTDKLVLATFDTQFALLRTRDGRFHFSSPDAFMLIPRSYRKHSLPP